MAKRKKSKRGFAGMNPEKRREIARKGGVAAHEKGTAHRWTSEEAQKAGQIGGRVKKADYGTRGKNIRLQSN